MGEAAAGNRKKIDSDVSAKGQKLERKIYGRNLNLETNGKKHEIRISKFETNPNEK